MKSMVYFAESAFHSVINMVKDLCNIPDGNKISSFSSYFSNYTLDSRTSYYLSGKLNNYSIIDTNGSISMIRPYAFFNMGPLSISLPKCTNIGKYAFCYSRYDQLSCLLTIHSLSECMALQSACFKSRRITVADSSVFAKCKLIGERAFESTVVNNSLNFPSCTSVGNYAFFRASVGSLTFGSTGQESYTHFYSCAFESCSCPKITVMGNGDFHPYAFSRPYVNEISIMGKAVLEKYCFAYCDYLQTIELLNCPSIGSYAFQYCSSLKTMKLSNCSRLDEGFVYSCKSLGSIYLYDSSVVSANAYTFYGLNSKCSFYVLSSLISQYLSASYWSSLSSNRFVPMEV